MLKTNHDPFLYYSILLFSVLFCSVLFWFFPLFVLFGSPPLPVKQKGFLPEPEDSLKQQRTLSLAKQRQGRMTTRKVYQQLFGRAVTQLFMDSKKPFSKERVSACFTLYHPSARTLLSLAVRQSHKEVITVNRTPRVCSQDTMRLTKGDRSPQRTSRNCSTSQQ